ncbi:MAG TPA: UDP-N-acetylglucosamine--N-acetylmuramyl-(pentapeptide) pyrophosphoryl-undecaprenol N-acetylglucosamine transferase [Dehalococcoidia bacterium]|nr:UDP-N-acetylglucosamine--N-acetylmuramyl-(pentapeptide) pyrophosphoryl-undecaprenol N-acetylglucosamine transferase [Dehalococcoidia bacterium]
MRVIFAGGGTGGHVYPALSVAASLRRSEPEADLLYLGTRGGTEERLVREHGIPFRVVRSGQIRGKSPWQIASSAARIAAGVLEAQAAFRSFAPDVVFATGGYASIPVVLGAALKRVSVTVFLPDVYPGWAVRIATLLATHVATTSDGALDYLPHSKTAVTGYPLRPEFWQTTRAEGRQRLGLDGGPCLLVSGASSGSRTLNDAILNALDALLEVCEVVHLTGRADETRVRSARARLPEPLRTRYHVHGYLDDIAWAMAAADLAVLRAGASSLAEPPAFGLPAILVPGAFSDQHRNAAHMASMGAAILLEEACLDELPALVRSLLGSNDRLAAMSSASSRLARPAAADEIAALLLNSRRAANVSEVCSL